MFIKDMEWSFLGSDFRIRNVPYTKIESDGEAFLDIETAIKLEMIIELMYTKSIASVVDYKVVSNLELDF